MKDTYRTRRELKINNKTFRYFSLPALTEAGFKGVEHFYRADPQGVEKGFVIYGGDMLPDTSSATVLNFRDSERAVKPL